MTDSPQTLTEKAPDQIEDAYWTFKGGTDGVSFPDTQEMLEKVETARITGTEESRWGVKVFLKIDTETVPQIVSKAVNAHDLVEVNRRFSPDETIEALVYKRKE